MDVRLNQPSLAVRLHRNCPEEFLLKVCELSRLGTGLPGDPQRRGRDQGAAAQGRDHRGGARLVPRRLRRAQPARQAPPVERLRPLQLRLGRRVRAVQRRAPAERSQARPRDRRPERLRDLRGVRGGRDGAARRAAPPHRHPGARDRGAAPRAAAVPAGLGADARLHRQRRRPAARRRPLQARPRHAGHRALRRRQLAGRGQEARLRREAPHHGRAARGAARRLRGLRGGARPLPRGAQVRQRRRRGRTSTCATSRTWS